MFSYVTSTVDNMYLYKLPYPQTKKPDHPYNYVGTFTYTWPINNQGSELSFRRNYEIKNEEFYSKDYENLNLKNAFASNYSIVFLNEDTINNEIPFIQTNKNQIHNLYHFFKTWNPRLFNKISLPPRSRIFLFTQENYKGKFLKFQNESDNSSIFEFNVYLDDDIKSFKWITEFPYRLPYTLNDNKQIFRPEYFNSSWNLNANHINNPSPMNLPLYESSTTPIKYTKINNMQNK